MTRSLKLLLALSLLASGTLHAGSLPAPLEAALGDAETRRNAADDLRFTFKLHSVTSEHDFQLRYDPSETDVWAVESPATEQTTKMRERLAKRAETQDDPPDRELLVGELRKLFGDRIELVDNRPEQRVYRFNLSEEAKIGGGGGGGGFDASKHLTGEVAVGRDNRLLWLRFFAEEAFKPVLVAKIKSFDMKLYYDPIWDGGPYVLVRQVMDLDGSAFFKSFKENANTVYSGFEKR